MALFAFWSSGCQFEGQQQPFSYAWFLIYPPIIEVMLCYYSVLNSFGWLLRFCICNRLFGVSVVLACLLHYSCKAMTTSDWFAIDDHISIVFYADELEELALMQLLTTSVALQINGDVKSIFFIKAAILAINLVLVALGEGHSANTQGGRKCRCRQNG